MPSTSSESGMAIGLLFFSNWPERSQMASARSMSTQRISTMRPERCASIRLSSSAKRVFGVKVGSVSRCRNHASSRRLRLRSRGLSLATFFICTRGVASMMSRSTQKLNILRITASRRLACTGAVLALVSSRVTTCLRVTSRIFIGPRCGTNSRRSMRSSSAQELLLALAHSR
ncbi:hypothetical protein D9M68_849400 [compost metagenome]